MSDRGETIGRKDVRQAGVRSLPAPPKKLNEQDGAYSVTLTTKLLFYVAFPALLYCILLYIAEYFIVE